MRWCGVCGGVARPEIATHFTVRPNYAANWRNPMDPAALKVEDTTGEIGYILSKPVILLSLPVLQGRGVNHTSKEQDGL